MKTLSENYFYFFFLSFQTKLDPIQNFLDFNVNFLIGVGVLRGKPIARAFASSTNQK